MDPRVAETWAVVVKAFSVDVNSGIHKIYMINSTHHVWLALCVVLVVIIAQVLWRLLHNFKQLKSILRSDLPVWSLYLKPKWAAG